eukprot:gene23775-1492_t
MTATQGWVRYGSYGLADLICSIALRKSTKGRGSAHCGGHEATAKMRAQTAFKSDAIASDQCRPLEFFTQQRFFFCNYEKNMIT